MNDGLLVDDTPGQVWAEVQHHLRGLRASWLVHTVLARAWVRYRFRG